MKDIRAWDLLIVADEATAALGGRLAAELRQRGLAVSLDTVAGPLAPGLVLDRAGRTRFALILGRAGQDTRYALLAAAAYQGAPVDEGAVKVGMVAGDEPALLRMVLQRLAR